MKMTTRSQFSFNMKTFVRCLYLGYDFFISYAPPTVRITLLHCKKSSKNANRSSYVMNYGSTGVTFFRLLYKPRREQVDDW